MNIKQWYKDWCKKTNRSGGVLVGRSTQELLTDAITDVKAHIAKYDVREELAEALENYLRADTKALTLQFLDEFTQSDKAREDYNQALTNRVKAKNKAQEVLDKYKNLRKNDRLQDTV